MGLTQTLQSGVMSAFTALGDLNVTTTYKSVTGQTRNIAAGTVTPVTTDTTLKYGVFVRLSEAERDSTDAHLTDAKFLFPRQLLNVEPKSADLVVNVATGKTWEIIQCMSPPGSAVTVLQVRTSK